MTKYLPSKVDSILLIALAQIGGGLHMQYGPGVALQITGGLLLMLGLIMARGGSAPQ
ncbi:MULTISPECIES: hypothetical protein [unclassified Oceanobacter]|uniref:hypothetical protein n=1 Tax=unclassified Oceanobacter TaxID=2620260 RepID=UPI002735F6E6|nr:MULTISPECIES: hypothetical protein [unclassified Oceanobacter]MDP2610034.1 hypothetical protein [Oceanobacter sp. 1_MG-2023]MDP2613330.1 hypothetical protein [Oceanobacter sp. 2_MG-2023]